MNEYIYIYIWWKEHPCKIQIMYAYIIVTELILKHRKLKLSFSNNYIKMSLLLNSRFSEFAKFRKFLKLELQRIQRFIFSVIFSDPHFKQLLTHSKFHRNWIKNNNYNNRFIETRFNFHFVSKIISVDITYIPKIQ